MHRDARKTSEETIMPFPDPSEYKVFKIPKKHGGYRQIEAPNAQLKAKQRKLLQDMKGLHYISPFVHSFRSNHNVVTNAKGHVGAKYVLHIDASNFFPSITYNNFRWRVNQYKLYETTEGWQKWMDRFQLCFCKFPGDTEERLPQGAPTSPWISNVYLSKFDTVMARYMTYMDVNISKGSPTEVSKYNYSRYADDITISGPDEKRLWAIYFMMEKRLSRRYGITLNRRKTRMMGPSRRKVVCGIVVNEKTQPKRRWRKNLRAEVFNKLISKGVPKDKIKEVLNQIKEGKPTDKAYAKYLDNAALGRSSYLSMCRKTEGYGSSESIFISRHSDVLSNL